VIQIVSELALAETTTVYLNVKEASDVTLGAYHLQVPFDSYISKLILFVATSDSSSESPVIDIIDFPTNNMSLLATNIITSTTSFFAMNIIPQHEQIHGVWTIEVNAGADVVSEFISLTILAESDLSFEMDLKVSFSGADSDFGRSTMGTVLFNEYLKVTTSPTIVATVATIDYISLVSLNGSQNVTRAAAENSVIFSPDDYDVGESFHISVQGIDSNGFAYFRMMNTLVTIQSLALAIVNATLNDTNLVIGTDTEVNFILTRWIQSGDDLSLTIQMSATSNHDDVSISFDSDSYVVFNQTTGSVTIAVPYNISLIGMELTVSLTAYEIVTGNYATVQMELSIVGDVVDLFAPTCEILSSSYEKSCGSFDPDAACNSSFWVGFILASDADDDGYGIELFDIVTKDDMLSIEVIVHQKNEIIVYFTSSCCYPRMDVAISDAIGQVSSCNTMNCERVEDFGIGAVNQTVSIACSQLESNNGQTDGEIAVTCQENGQWSDLVWGCSEPSEEGHKKCCRYKKSKHKHGHKKDNRECDFYVDANASCPKCCKYKKHKDGSWECHQWKH